MKLYLAAMGAIGVAGAALAAGIQIFTEETALIDALDRAAIETFNDVVPGSVLAGGTVDLEHITFRYDGSPDGGQGDPFLGQPLFEQVSANPLDIQFFGEVNADGTPSGLHFFDFDEPTTGFGGTFIGATTGANLTIFTDTATGLGSQSNPIKLSDFLNDEGTGFFGFTSSVPFSTVAFGVEATTDPNNDKSSEVFRLDDVVYQAPVPDTLAPVPLPPSMYMLLASFGFLVWRGRRNRAA